jgi:hypothetical protein
MSSGLAAWPVVTPATSFSSCNPYFFARRRIPGLLIKRRRFIALGLQACSLPASRVYSPRRKPPALKTLKSTLLKFIPPVPDRNVGAVTAVLFALRSDLALLATNS